MTSKVGIVANPASGKDVRRLVSYGTVLDNMEKIDVVRQMISGADSVKVDEILIMPDVFEIGCQAIEGLLRVHSCDISILDMPITGTAADSTAAASMMSKIGVGCILTLGGDGTNRAVAKGSQGTPILPIAAGTNNVVPLFTEGTVAGITAGILATRVVKKDDGTFRSKKLNVIKNGHTIDLALVDVAVYDSPFEGARALLDLSKVKQVIATRGHQTRIGMTSIVGNLCPIEVTEERGINIRLGNPGIVIKATLAPGIVEDVGIETYNILKIHERQEIFCKPSTLALDGEREIRVLEKDVVEVELRKDGPYLVSVEKVLKEGLRKGFFITKHTRVG